jgi:hypothetical protein
MSNAVIALLIGLATATWLYSKIMNKTGNNRQNSIITAIVSGILLFIVLYFALGIIFK